MNECLHMQAVSGNSSVNSTSNEGVPFLPLIFREVAGHGYDLNSFVRLTSSFPSTSGQDY